MAAGCRSRLKLLTLTRLSRKHEMAPAASIQAFNCTVEGVTEACQQMEATTRESLVSAGLVQLIALMPSWSFPTENMGAAAVGIVAIGYIAVFNAISLAFNCKLHPQRKQAATNEPSRFDGVHWAKRYTGPFWLWITNRCAGRSFASDPGQLQLRDPKPGTGGSSGPYHLVD